MRPLKTWRSTASPSTTASSRCGAQTHAEQVEPREVEVALVLVERLAGDDAARWRARPRAPAARRLGRVEARPLAAPVGDQHRPRDGAGLADRRPRVDDAAGQSGSAGAVRARAGRDDDAVEAVGRRGGRLLAQPQLHAGARQVALAPAGGSAPTSPRARARGRPARSCPPTASSRSTQRHGVAAPCAAASAAATPGRPAADDQRARRPAAARGSGWPLAARAQVDRAGDRARRRGSGRCSPGCSRCRGSSRPRRRAGLGDELGIGDQRARHADGVGGARRRRCARRRRGRPRAWSPAAARRQRGAQLPHRRRDRVRGRRAAAARSRSQPEYVAESPSAASTKSTSPSARERPGDLGAGVGVEARERRLVRGQAHADRDVRARPPRGSPRAPRGRSAAGVERAVVAVVAVVGARREELRGEVGVGRRELDPVHPALARPHGAGAEAVDQLARSRPARAPAARRGSAASAPPTARPPARAARRRSARGRRGRAAGTGACPCVRTASPSRR